MIPLHDKAKTILVIQKLGRISVTSHKKDKKRVIVYVRERRVELHTVESRLF